MFSGVDHIVIAVKDIDNSVKQYEAIYGPVSDREESSASSMVMGYFRFPDSYIELVSNLGEDGPIAKRLADHGEGIHLIAMKVDNMDSTLAVLRDRGVRLIGDPGPGNPVVGQVFIHPSAAGGVLTQLVER